MSCSNIDDLEDIADNLFDFGDEAPRPKKRERPVRKPKKHKEQPSTEEEPDAAAGSPVVTQSRSGSWKWRRSLRGPTPSS